MEYISICIFSNTCQYFPTVFPNTFQYSFSSTCILKLSYRSIVEFLTKRTMGIREEEVQSGEESDVNLVFLAVVRAASQEGYNVFRSGHVSEVELNKVQDATHVRAKSLPRLKKKTTKLDWSSIIQDQVRNAIMWLDFCLVFWIQLAPTSTQHPQAAIPRSRDGTSHPERPRKILDL